MGGWAWDVERFARSSQGGGGSANGRYYLGVQIAAMELMGKMPRGGPMPKGFEPEGELGRLHTMIFVERYLRDGEALPTDLDAAFDELREPYEDKFSSDD